MKPTIVTIGNPNCGKSSLYNAITGAKQKVGNWGGVTVERKQAQLTLAGVECELVDLPGIYDLSDHHDSTDEHITTSFLLQKKPDLVLNIVDASCLTRSLYLTLQLRELGVPLILVLNKMDVLKHKRQVIDLKQLEIKLGCPVIALSSRKNADIKKLKSTIGDYLHQQPEQRHFQCDYNDWFEQAMTQVQTLMHSCAFSPRGHAMLYLESSRADALPTTWTDAVAAQRVHQSTNDNFDLDLHVADVRYGFIHQLLLGIVRQQGQLNAHVSDSIDSVVLNRWFGVPFFLFMMYTMFMFSIQFGGVFIDFFDILAGTLFVDLPAQWLSSYQAPDWVISVLTSGVGAGLQTVATFIPIIAALYLFLAVLESSGYLARAAFVVDSLMNKIGLPGKAFVPMLMGFGCTVPAVMAARTLTTERERLLTSSMSPFMSCGARLPVYALFAVAFFPDSGQNLVFALYLIGILVAILTGLLLNKTILPGVSALRPMEMPDYEMPMLRNVIYLTWNKLKGFLLGAGKTIVFVVTILGVLNTLGTDGRFGHAGRETSLLSTLSKQITPLFAPMGIDRDNWQATVGIITGIFAKEALVGTLNSLYMSPDDLDDAPVVLSERWQEATISIYEGLGGMTPSDPMNLRLGDLYNTQETAIEQGVDQGVYVNLQKHFDGQVGAFAYLLFILLYMPCAAAMGAMVREMGKAWAWGSAMWCNFTAFMAATLFYQFATFMQHPAQACFWLLFFMLVLLLLFVVLQNRGNILSRKMVAV